jgi:hypothetical protein
MIAVPSAARFWDQMNARQAQVQGLVRTLHRVLGASSPRRTQLILLVTGMRHRMVAVLLQGEPLLRKIRELRGNISPRKAILTLVAAGVVGVAFIIVLLEVSMRKELAKVHTDAGIGAIPIPSTSPDRTAFDDAFVIQPTNLAASEFMDRVGDRPIPDHAETFGKVSRKPVPLPRPRPKSR